MKCRLRHLQQAVGYKNLAEGSGLGGSGLGLRALVPARVVV